MLVSAVPLDLHDNANARHSETQVSTIEAAFQDFTERKDIAILLINQHVRAPSLDSEECYLSMYADR